MRCTRLTDGQTDRQTDGTVVTSVAITGITDAFRDFIGPVSSEAERLTGTHCRITVDSPNFSALLSVALKG